MADPIKVRLKNIRGNIFHPETEWSAVVNRPSIYDAANDTYIGTADTDTVHMEAQDMQVTLRGNLTISTSKTNSESVSLDEYPFNWDTLNGNPFKKIVQLMIAAGDKDHLVPNSPLNLIFGTYEVTDSTTGFPYYSPAFSAIQTSHKISADLTDNLCDRSQYGYYINEKGYFIRIEDMSKFHGFLEQRKTEEP